ncbi:cell wall-active antibiotics response protein LiaF [Paenibacillus sp. TRM 82003]|nr:cell wall-active antibiotics response protein LiaF [Paenibacillus sp. TRM 82003]
MEDGKRQTAYLLIGAGLYLAVGHLINFLSAGALVLAALGYTIVRATAGAERRDLSGYVLLVFAGLVLIANHWAFLIGVVVAAVGWFLYRSKSSGKAASEGNPYGPAFVKQHIVANLRWGQGVAWTVRSSDVSVAIAEVKIDLTNALFEEPVTTLRLQGIIGDIDIVVPEDVGLTVNAQVAIGEIQVAGERGAGLMNRLVWRSPNADAAEFRVHIDLSYAIADVDVKVL